MYKLATMYSSVLIVAFIPLLIRLIFNVVTKG